MSRFIYYTTKLDTIHVVDHEQTGTNKTTLCGKDATSVSYMDNDRYKKIDQSRKEERKFCEECNRKMLEQANKSLEWWDENYGGIEDELNKSVGLQVQPPAQPDYTQIQQAMEEEPPRKEKARPTIRPGYTDDGKRIELTPESTFPDGESIDDIPRCAIPGCNNEDVKYWIHPEGKLCRYFCGDCPESDIEKLDAFAKTIGCEVGSYDPPVFSIDMAFTRTGWVTKTWLIKAHNMAAAIEKAQNGEHDMIITETNNFHDGRLAPVDIRHADEEELEYYESRGGGQG